MRLIRPGLILTLFFGLSCAPRFSGRDISELMEARNAKWPVDASTKYSVYGGYGSGCAHSGAHIYFGNTTENRVYSPADALVTEVKKCVPGDEHDKYTIVLTLGMKGSTPVYLEMEFEPLEGKLCSGDGADGDAFRKHIFVNEGQKVIRGELIARFVATDPEESHIHMHLNADGSSICPEIFPANFATEFTPQAMTLKSSTCGSDQIQAETLCHALTESEKPERLK